ncbi:MAG: transporter substrate-binding protein [Bacteroidetes bacterium]|nr:transporter substrate-binding protein [Bacteroidota bacterium]
MNTELFNNKLNIKIGLLHSLTGTMAISEVPLLKAELLAIKEINEMGGVLGKQILPVIEDGASNPKTFAMKAEKIITQDKTFFLFGGWTSHTRKAVKNVVEKHNALFWYPIQYEGLEQSENIFYTGSCLNQQIIPAIQWCLEQGWKTFYLLGSDYIYPITANKLIISLLSNKSAEIVGERYVPLGQSDFEEILIDIQKKKPDVIINTINGYSNIHFFNQFEQKCNSGEKQQIFSTSITAQELKNVEKNTILHSSCWSYFKSLDNPLNNSFKKNFLLEYKNEFSITDPVAMAFTQIFMWKQIVEACNSISVDKIQKKAPGQKIQTVFGEIEFKENNHIAKKAYIGKWNKNDSFEIVYESSGFIDPLPWLGVENLDSFLKPLLLDVLSRYPDIENLVIQDTKVIQKSHEHLHSVYEYAPDAIFICDYFGGIYDANRKAIDSLGYTKQKLLSLTIMEIDTVFTDQGILQKHFDNISKDNSVNLFGQHKKKNGETFPVEIHISLYEGQDEKLFLAFVRDISERLKMQERLLQNERLLSDIEIINKSGGWEYSKETGEMYWTEGLYGVYEIPINPMIDHISESLNCFYPEDKEKISSAFQQCLNDGLTYDLEFPLITYANNHRWIRVKAQPIFEKNEVIKVIGSITDITENLKSEEERNRLTTAIEQAAETIIITDVSGNIQYANPAAEGITGYTTEELLGQNTRIFKSGKHEKSYYSKLWEILLNGDTWSGKFINKKKDGSLYTEEAIISPVRNSIEEIVNFVSVKRDISKETKMEDQIRQFEKMESIGQLAGGIAHDFNNMLAVIIGYAEMLLMDVNEESFVGKNINQILIASERAKNLVKQILTFSRYQVENLEPIFLKPIIDEVMQLLQATIPSSVQLDLEIEKDTEPVLAESTKIHEVIVNLCTNATQAMGEMGVLKLSLNEIHIETQVMGQIGIIKPGFYSLLSVKDNGGGMDKETFIHMFEPFFTTKEIGAGTGMGLAVVFGIMKQFNGNIIVKSEIGIGTEVQLFFPKTDDLFKEKMEKEIDVFGGQESILLVDDEEQLSNVIGDILRNIGYKVTIFSEGEAALRAFEQNPDSFDLLITDQTMPGLCGFELAKYVKKLRKSIPIILCTGFSNQLDEQMVLEAGIEGFLTKPFNIKELTQKIRRIIDIKTQ